MAELGAIMTKLEEMTNHMKKLETQQEEMKSLLTKDIKEINDNLDDHRARIEALEDKVQALMETEEEQEAEDWNEIMMAENNRRKMAKKVEMASFTNENTEKMSFKDQLNMNLKLDGKKIGLRKLAVQSFRERDYLNITPVNCLK